VKYLILLIWFLGRSSAHRFEVQPLVRLPLEAAVVEVEPVQVPIVITRRPYFSPKAGPELDSSRWDRWNLRVECGLERPAADPSQLILLP
jgi:hypothetical protein